MISLNQSEPQCIFWSTVSKQGNEIFFNNSISVAPLSVTISNKLRKLLAGKEYSFTCLSQGYSPTVEFLWFLENTNMPHPSLQQVIRKISTSSYMYLFQKGEVSLLQFRPSIEDHGKTLRCQAFNPVMPLQSIQDSLVLDIYCKDIK